MTDRLETRLIHAGAPRPRILGSAVVPIFQGAVFEQAEGAAYGDLVYPRLSTLPNHHALAGKLASVEGGEAALVTASGMAAISTALLAVLAPGGHLLAQSTLYGGTHAFVTHDLGALGLSFDFIDADAPATWEGRLRPHTRAIYVEAMTNPLLQVADHEAVADFARRHGLIAIIDNTFATPVNFRPLEHGFHLVAHSATKYLNGHSDLAAGALIGSRELVGRAKGLLDHLGGSLDPHACFLLDRGMKTLALRVRQQGASALTLARALEAHPAVARVNYPGLSSHPRHARAAALFAGFGGMMSFELKGGAPAAVRTIGRLRIPIHAPSLGGVETLVTRPAVTSHASLPPAERARLGIGDGLVRVSVGLEAVEDLVADFTQALEGRPVA